MDDDDKKIRERLWNTSMDAKSYEGASEKYHTAILEQYKLYVEMADRISNRRGLTNTFFLTVNTIVFTIIGVFWKDRPTISPWVLMLLIVIMFGQCTAWWWIVRSYRQLNTAKYKVIGALEERLPALVYWQAEWVALGEGKDWRKYLPLTHIEQWVPVLFALIYLSGFVVSIALYSSTAEWFAR